MLGRKISILVIFLLFSCKTKSKNNNDEITIKTSNDSSKALIIESNQFKENSQSGFEYINIDSLRLNKDLFYGKRSLIEKTLKSADSINDFGYECGSALDEQNSIYYSSLNEIEVSNDRYAYRLVYFNSEKQSEIDYKGIILVEITV